MGVTHYDEPPPDHLDDLEELRRTDRFREANELRAFIEVEDGRIVGHGHLGQGHIGATTVRVGPAAIRFPAVHLPDIRPEPDVTADIGAVRPDRRRPDGPADATARAPQAVRAVLAVDRVDDAGADAQRRRLIDPRAGRRQPVPAPLDLRRRRAGSSRSRASSTSRPGSTIRSATARRGATSDSPAVVASVESALERQLSTTIMRGGAKPRIRTLVGRRRRSCEQGAPGTDVYLILDGIFVVEVDGEQVAEIGPGAVVGERAALEGGLRTATLRATTAARVAEVPADGLDTADLEVLAATRHRGEDASKPAG